VRIIYSFRHTTGIRQTDRVDETISRCTCYACCSAIKSEHAIGKVPIRNSGRMEWESAAIVNG